MQLSKLKVNPRNPQIFNDLDSLKRSIQQFPKMMKLRPLVYDPETMHVLGGNKRLVCLQELGYKEIPDDWVRSAADLTEDEKKRFVITDNVQFGEFDFEILGEDYETDELEDWGVNTIDITKINELEEWEQLTDDKFELADKEIKVILIFNSEKQRENYIKEKDINITKKHSGQWTSRI